MRIKIFWVIGFLCFFPGINRSEEPDTLSFTLQQAMSYASQHAFQKISSDFDVASARKKIWETFATGLPQVDLNGRYNHSIDVPVSLLPAEIIPEDMRPPGTGPGDKVPISFSTAYDANYSVSVSQMLLDGSWFVGIQAARVFLEMAHQQAEKTEIEIRDGVARAYFLVLAARKNLTAFEENLKVNESILAETRALYENGFRESMDVSQIGLMVRDAQKKILEGTRNEEVALAVLRFSMGLKEDQPLLLGDALGELTSSAIVGNETLGNRVLDDHVDYRMALTNEEVQNLQLKNLKVQYLPKLEAFYTFQKTGYNDQWNLFDQEWYKAQFIGVSLTMPIFSSGMRQAQVKQQNLALQKSQNEREMTARNLKTQYLTALTEFNSAIDQYELTRESQELALDIYEKTRVKFKNGIVGSFELTQQQGQYIQAQINHVQTALALMNARINYLKAVGEL
jgi:outer membrane protein TolC